MSIPSGGIFAAFAFPTKVDARAAWLHLRDKAHNFSNVSAWALQSTTSGTWAVVILGEDQERVDECAAIIAEAPNCRGDYVMSEGEMESLAHRRYNLLAEQINQGARVIHQEASYAAEGGRPIYRDGSDGT